MGTVQLEKVTKIYENGFCAFESFDLFIPEGSFTVLLGPSGCGKSTLLRMIAGLEPLSSGKILLDGRDISDRPPQQRNMAMVFQNYALYPHWRVRENLEFGLKLKGVGKKERKKAVTEMAERMKLTSLLDRKPAALSGGQQQRVAMGRALMHRPEVLLMDEPLSNLDAELRGCMRAEVAALYREEKNTIVYVTHDQIEAMTLGTQIVVLNQGRIHQIGTPEEIYTNPADTFVASFIGNPGMNLVPAILCDAHTVKIGDQKWSWTHLNGKAGSEVILGIRPEDLALSSEEGLLGVKIRHQENLGSEYRIFCTLGETVCQVLSTQPVMTDTAFLNFDPEHVKLFDRDTGRACAP